MKERFFSWLNERLDEYAVNRDRAVRAHATRWAQVAAKLNNGDLPTMSGDETTGFRMHAPYDGYVHRWMKGDEEFERTYLGGQYLPYDSDDLPFWGGSSTGETTIFDVPAECADKFAAEWKEAGIDGKVISVRVSRNSYRKSYYDGELKVVTISHCPDDIRRAIDNYIMGDIYKLRQLEVKQAEDAREKRDAAHAAGEDAPEGRLEITGIILSTKEVESEWGITLKMLVQDDRGFRVWGTVPSSLKALRGDRVKFTATLTQSDKDPKFGFFKRPAKAEVLEAD